MHLTIAERVTVLTIRMYSPLRVSWRMCTRNRETLTLKSRSVGERLDLARQLVDKSPSDANEATLVEMRSKTLEWLNKRGETTWTRWINLTRPGAYRRCLKSRTGGLLASSHLRTGFRTDGMSIGRNGALR